MFMLKKVTVLEKDGIKLATLINPEGKIEMENLKDFVPCPKELLLCVPSEFLKFCIENNQKFFFINSQYKWESIPET